MRFKKFQKVKTALLATAMSVMLFSTSAFAEDRDEDGYNYGKTTTKEYDRIAEHQSALNGVIQAPKDYTGVGYLLEHLYGLEPEFPSYNGIDQYTNVAIGGLETTIEKGADNHYYLSMKGYCEFNMDCWTVDWNWFKFSGMGYEKDPYSSVKGADGKDYKSDFAVTTNPEEVHVGDIPDIYVYTKQDKTYTKNEDFSRLDTIGVDENGYTIYYNSWDQQFKEGKSNNVAVRVGDPTKTTDLWKDEPAGGGNYKVSYFGSDGVIDCFYTVNGSSSVKKATIKVQSPNAKNPAGGYLLPSQAYVSYFEEKFDLGIQPISNVRFRSINGENSSMYVLGDGSCYPELVEEVALIDKQADNNEVTYTVQLDANVAYSGNYTIPFYYTDASGVMQTLKQNIYLKKGKDTYTFTITVPQGAYNFSLGGITSDSEYYDNRVRKVKEKYFNIDICGLSHSNIVVGTADNYKGELNIDTVIDYNVSNVGTYLFTYSYAVPGAEIHTMDRKYITYPVEIEDKNGRLYTKVTVPVKDTCEVKLSSVKSPDGTVKIIDKAIYENFDYEQAKPNYVDASVEVIKAQKNSGRNVVVEAIIKWAIPAGDKSYALIIETKNINGSYNYITKPLGSKAGYYKHEYGYMTSTADQPLVFDKNAAYVKLYWIEETDTHNPVFSFKNQYLYCDHVYSYDCDEDCDRCGAFRETTPHTYDSVCDQECNVCHEHRLNYVDHKFSHGCSVKCENTGCKFEPEVIIHEVDSFCDTKCKWCDLEVEPVHYFKNNKCEKCGFVRTVKTGWVPDGDKWSFYSKDGIKQTGWKFIKNNWYYMDKNGIMQTGFKTIGGKVYYFDEAKKTEGIMVTGLRTINGKKYYFDNKTGVMGVGWKKVADKWYFFDQNNQGAAVMNKWIKSGTNWYYLGKDGIMVTNNWSPKDSQGRYFWLNADGIMLKNKWITWKGNYYYLGADGAMLTNKWVKDNGKYYWVGSQGNMLRSQWVDDGKFYVDSTGAYDPTKIK